MLKTNDPNGVNLSTSEDPLIIVVSNRGPYSFTVKADQTFNAKRGAGGLVTALGALAEERDVLWIASALSKGDRQWATQNDGAVQTIDNIDLKLILPNKKQYSQYYSVISNPLLWFIQHQLWDVPRNPSISQKVWQAWENGYVKINEQFADSIVEVINTTDKDRPIIVMPQDYHLYMVPHFIREKTQRPVQIQPFIHIPWPSPDAWRILPGQMRNAILESLLKSDRIGFQTKADSFNFVQTCRFYVENAHSHGKRDSIVFQGRHVQANAYPISIDIEKVQELALERETLRHEDEIHNFVGNHQLILRIDRVEPSKNIIRGLEAFRQLLEQYPSHRRKVKMVALLVPSRMEVDEYQDYLTDIMAEAGLINAKYGDGAWEPIRIMLGNNYPRAIAAMKLYDVLIVNPIADGMNLVAKEGPLLNQCHGTLVLSEQAGAFYELGEDSLTISPFDTYGTTQALHKGLTMPYAERKERSEKLKNIVLSSSVRQWFFNQADDALQAIANHSNNASTD